MTSAHVDVFPRQITLPLVVAVYASGAPNTTPSSTSSPSLPRENGWARSKSAGSGRIRRGAAQALVTTRPFPFQVTGPGTYSIGLYETPDAADTDVLFPLTVLKFNPLTAPRS